MNAGNTSEVFSIVLRVVIFEGVQTLLLIIIKINIKSVLAFSFVQELVLLANVINSAVRGLHAVSSLDLHAANKDCAVVGPKHTVKVILRVISTGELFANHETYLEAVFN